MSELEPTRTCSNPTATEGLRRMLDERGVEWTVPDESWNQDSITYWKVGSIKWVAFESENDTLWLNCNSVTDLTPEQAIAATLGRGECRNLSKYVNVFECSCCGWTYDFVVDPYSGPRFCPNCGRRIEQ